MHRFDRHCPALSQEPSRSPACNLDRSDSLRGTGRRHHRNVGQIRRTRRCIGRGCLGPRGWCRGRCGKRPGGACTRPRAPRFSFAFYDAVAASGGAVNVVVVVAGARAAVVVGCAGGLHARVFADGFAGARVLELAELAAHRGTPGRTGGHRVAGLAGLGDPIAAARGMSQSMVGPQPGGQAPSAGPQVRALSVQRNCGALCRRVTARAPRWWSRRSRRPAPKSGQLPMGSQVSPVSTTPLPHRAAQSLSLVLRHPPDSSRRPTDRSSAGRRRCRPRCRCRR